MKLAAWISNWLRARSSPRPAAAREILEVVNCTRQSVLATALEVAASGEKRRKGLLGRAGLAPGEGLWILPCESVHTFFMRFPMDAVFLDKELRVRRVVEGVKPFRFAWSRGARSVVELPAGEAGRVGVVEGMQLSWHDQVHAGG